MLRQSITMKINAVAVCCHLLQSFFWIACFGRRVFSVTPTRATILPHLRPVCLSCCQQFRINFVKYFCVNFKFPAIWNQSIHSKLKLATKSAKRLTQLWHEFYFHPWNGAHIVFDYFGDCRSESRTDPKVLVKMWAVIHWSLEIHYFVCGSCCWLVLGIPFHVRLDRSAEPIALLQSGWPPLEPVQVWKNYKQIEEFCL